MNVVQICQVCNYQCGTNPYCYHCINMLRLLSDQQRYFAQRALIIEQSYQQNMSMNMNMNMNMNINTKSKKEQYINPASKINPNIIKRIDILWDWYNLNPRTMPNFDVSKVYPNLLNLIKKYHPHLTIDNERTRINKYVCVKSRRSKWCMTKEEESILSYQKWRISLFSKKGEDDLKIKQCLADVKENCKHDKTGNNVLMLLSSDRDYCSDLQCLHLMCKLFLIEHNAAEGYLASFVFNNNVKILKWKDLANKCMHDSREINIKVEVPHGVKITVTTTPTPISLPLPLPTPSFNLFNYPHLSHE